MKVAHYAALICSNVWFAAAALAPTNGTTIFAGCLGAFFFLLAWNKDLT